MEPPTRSWTVLTVAALFLIAASPLAGANGQSQTCVTLTYIPMGSTVDVVVQRGNSVVVMLVMQDPGQGLTLGVTVSPDICRFTADIQAVRTQAEMQQKDAREQAPVLP